MSAYRSEATPALGALIADHRPRSFGRIAISIFFLLVAIVIDLASLASPPHGVNQWLILILWGILAPAIALLSLFGRKPEHVRIHEHALVVGARIVPWDELVELRTHRYLAGRRTLKPVLDRHYLRTRDGQSLEVRCGLVDLDGLLEQMRARTLERMLSEARERLAAGETVAFGKLSLDGTSIRTADTTLPRASIESISFEGPGQTLTIKGKGSAWLEAPLEDVGNPHVLLALLR